MTDKEIRQAQRSSWPSQTQRAKRKVKLKMRFKDKLDSEIQSTSEKLQLLLEIKDETNERS